MALPSSGQLSMNDIRTELGIPSQSPFSLDTAINGGYVALNECSAAKPNPATPQAISEWYSYNHATACYNVGSFKFSSLSCDDACTGPFNTTLYSCCSPLANGCKVWTSLTNGICTSPVPDVTGYYSNGTNCYTVSSGVITATSACTTNVTYNIYIKYGNDPSGETLSNFGFYYALSSDGSTYGSDILIAGGSSISTTCNSFSISVPSNNYGAFGFRTTNTGKGGYGVYFTGTKFTTCPTQAQDYCGTYAVGGSPYVTNWSTSGGNLYFTIYVDGKADPAVFVSC